jgi:tetratricopeptide (TPR) repeat protein
LGIEMYLPQTLWMMGYPDQALAELHQEEALLSEMTHPFSRVMGLSFLSRGYQLLSQSQIVQRLAVEEVQISKEHGITLYEAWGLTQLGWSLVVQDQPEPGIEYLQQGIDELRRKHMVLLYEEVLGYYGDALAKAGRVHEGRLAIDEGIEMSQKTGMAYWQAELFRLKGNILAKEGEETAAENWYMKAIETARQQQVLSWELRAVTCLARLWQAQGRQAEARVLLEPVYGRFHEGFDSPDLLEARAVLSEIGY